MKNNKLIKGLMVFVIYIVFPLLLGMFLPSIGDSKTPELVLYTFFYLIVLLSFIFVYRSDFKDEAIGAKKNIKKTLTIILVSFVSLILLVTVFQLLIYKIFPTIEYSNSIIVNAYLQKATWFMIFVLMIYSPIVEEIVFRKVFKDIIQNKVFFVIFSALIFGFCQIGYNISSLENILSIIPYAVLGGVCAISYVKSDSIYVPIVIRILYNIFLLVLHLI
ncbi:MAG: lysostaphin resistance A-like protein [Bacilli bacterium]